MPSQIHNVAIFAYLAGIMQKSAPRNAVVFHRKKSRYADSSSQGRNRADLSQDPYTSGVIRRAHWAIFSS